MSVLPVRQPYNYGQVYDSFSHDPFLEIIHRNDFHEIKNLIEGSNENRSGTAFLNFHGEISQEKFLRIYEAIPDSLKCAYLLIKDRDGNTILHHFAKYGEFNLVEKTFSYLSEEEKYYCICFQNDIGQTPLHWIVINGNEKTGAKMLISIEDNTLRAACFDILDNEGKSPLGTPTRCINAATIIEDLKATLG